MLSQQEHHLASLVRFQAHAFTFAAVVAVAAFGDIQRIIVKSATKIGSSALSFKHLFLEFHENKSSTFDCLEDSEYIQRESNSS